MKLFPRIVPVMMVGLCAVTSCDKVSDLTEKMSGLWEEESTVGVVEVDEKEGKSIIAEESRLVMVEFYSDT